MDLFEMVCNDVREMARYWILRRFLFQDWTNELFMGIVDPSLQTKSCPEPNVRVLINMAYTEWLLFECGMRDGQTPLELYVEDPPQAVDGDSIGRLRQIGETQFFSRFEILAKDRAAGIATLRDVRTDLRYDVLDPHVCEVDRWSAGTIAERIACVDGRWMHVGQMHLYDHAVVAATGTDGPGEFHPEDVFERPYLEHAGYFLRLMHDVLGVDGRYRDTTRAIAMDGPEA